MPKGSRGGKRGASGVEKDIKEARDVQKQLSAARAQETRLVNKALLAGGSVITYDWQTQTELYGESVANEKYGQLVKARREAEKKVETIRQKIYALNGKLEKISQRIAGEADENAPLF